MNFNFQLTHCSMIKLKRTKKTIKVNSAKPTKPVTRDIRPK
jgi:hypothetical protein